MELNIIMLTIGAAFLIAVLLGPLFIPFLRRLKFGQTIREEGPKAHYKKAGTPTMGGMLIIVAMFLTVLKFAGMSLETVILLFVTLAYGMLGFLDDYLKILRKHNLGLTAKQKLLGQLIIGLVFYFALIKHGQSPVLHIPGVDFAINLHWAYLPFILFITVGAPNAVNLTDGLDGLLAGTSAVAFGAYAVIAWAGGYYEVAIFAAAMVGAVLGFLVFNAHPAKVFMGDTGSLALGGALTAIAVLTKTELLLVIIGGIFVIETLSVILQVASFKLRGKRIFRMSPIHHHFELVGWSEWRVVTTFWFVGIVFAAIGLYIEVLK